MRVLSGVQPSGIRARTVLPVFMLIPCLTAIGGGWPLARGEALRGTGRAGGGPRSLQADGAQGGGKETAPAFWRTLRRPSVALSAEPGWRSRNLRGFAVDSNTIPFPLFLRPETRRLGPAVRPSKQFEGKWLRDLGTSRWDGVHLGQNPR